VLERASQAGIVRILVPGWDLASSEAALELCARRPELLVAGVGVHPHHAAEMDEPGWARLETLAADTAARAIGEIGLDFFRNLSPPDVQADALRRQLDLARRLGKPVLVHDRDAHDAVTGALLEPVTQPVLEGSSGSRSGAGGALRGVLHAFSGDARMAARLAAAGYLISFALPLSFRSAVGPRAAAASIPPTAILVETDSPYLGPDREARNEPTTALRVAAELARLRETTPEQVAVEAGANLAGLLAATPSP
jgi:TatD DNase family protein